MIADVKLSSTDLMLIFDTNLKVLPLMNSLADSKSFLKALQAKVISSLTEPSRFVFSTTSQYKNSNFLISWS